MINHPDAIHSGAQGNGFQDIDLIFQGCIGGAFGDGRHHSAGHGTVEQRSVPAAMHRPHWIGDFEFRGATKHRAPLRDFVQGIAQLCPDWGAGQAPFQYALHELKPGKLNNLIHRQQIGWGFCNCHVRALLVRIPKTHPRRLLSEVPLVRSFLELP